MEVDMTAGDYELQVSKFRSPLMEVFIDGLPAGEIFCSPYHVTFSIKALENNVHRFAGTYPECYLGLVEPYTIGVEINRRAQITADDKVLIMGSGLIGICAMQVAKKNGADETVLVTEEDLDQRLWQFTDGEGVPVIVDTICQPESFEQSVQLAAPAGRVVVIGLKNQPSNITMADITKKELTIVGSRLNNHCFPEVIAGFEAGQLQPEELMTRRFHYSEIREALKLITERPQEVLKVVLGVEE